MGITIVLKFLIYFLAKQKMCYHKRNKYNNIITNIPIVCLPYITEHEYRSYKL